MLSNALIGLGSARMGQGDLAGAKVAFDEGLRRAVDFAHQETVARAFDAIAAMAGRSGDASDGAILFGAAEGLRRSVGGIVWAIDRGSHEDTANLLHDRLGDDTYQDLSRRGGGLALDELLDRAAAVGSRHCRRG